MKYLLIAICILSCAGPAPVTAHEEPDERSREETAVEKELAFPETHWDEMRGLMEKDGAPAVIEFIAGLEDDEQRRQLYSLAQRAFGYREWEGKNFDALIEVVNAGIAEGLRQSEAAADAETAAKLVDYANVLSYNLSADLAECWPGDTRPRERRHLEAGLKAAEDCLRWREEMKRGPFPFSIAHWAKGMHLLSLGDTDGALANFQKSFDYAVEFAASEGKDASLSAEGEFGPLLASGYVGIAAWVKGDEAGKRRYEEATAAFKDGAEKDEDKKDDFQFGLDQLEWVKGKFIK